MAIGVFGLQVAYKLKRLEVLELESNLVLDGGVRGDLHREYRVD